MAIAKRQLLLAADVVLTIVERLWVVAAGGWQRRSEGRSVDPTTGRTSVEHLRGTGIAESGWHGFDAALESGIDPNILVAEFDKVTDQTAEELAAELRRRAPQMLREHRAVQRGMRRRMRAVWGPAFDALYEVYVCVEELGSDMQQLHADEEDSVVQALLALHARVCLVLAEIHALFTEGFPLGAWARTRSLHETAVVASLLSKFGREPGMDDLAEGFLLHAVVDHARDLELAIRNGIEVDAEELAIVRARREAVIGRFGPMFAKDYGWTRPLFPSLQPKERVTFARLEELAESGLNRTDYRAGGHHVHSSAWTVELNKLSRGDVVYRLTGPTNVGFAEPASVALAATLASTAAIVHGVEPLPEPMYLMGVRALAKLSVRAVELFGEAQTLVDEREARVQKR